ncbi:MAG: hypothetical protein GWP91_08600 [Rhodobacterales bacterium]|nr:hypothetical protein [Rhodobacterales bacterium]
MTVAELPDVGGMPPAVTAVTFGAAVSVAYAVSSPSPQARPPVVSVVAAIALSPR